MPLDAETAAFLALTDAEVAAWTLARAARQDLALPEAATAAVIDNAALLRGQTALFVAALGAAAGEPAETFAP